jgi:hypothetical protein
MRRCGGQLLVTGGSRDVDFDRSLGARWRHGAQIFFVLDNDLLDHSMRLGHD